MQENKYKPTQTLEKTYSLGSHLHSERWNYEWSLEESLTTQRRTWEANIYQSIRRTIILSILLGWLDILQTCSIRESFFFWTHLSRFNFEMSYKLKYNKN